MWSKSLEFTRLGILLGLTLIITICMYMCSKSIGVYKAWLCEG